MSVERWSSRKGSFVTRLARTSYWLARALVGGLLVALLGRLRWEAPGWLRAAGRGAAAGGGWARRRPVPALALVVALTGAGLGVRYAVRWYQSRPKPVTMELTLIAPALTPVEKVPRPHPLVLKFGGSAAPIAQIGKPVTSGIELAPAIEGSWRWERDNRLVFTPKHDWPVGQEVAVRLARRGLLADLVLLAEYKLTFTTAPFAARFGQVQFYQDPVEPEQKKVVATVNFTHAVDVPSFEKQVKLALKDSSQPFAFKVSYNALRSQAFIHSDRVAIPSRDSHMDVTVGAGVRAARGGPPTASAISSRVRIPGLYNHLRIDSVRLTVASDERLQPVQVLMIETTVGVADRELAAKVSAYLLPLHHPDQRGQKAPRPYQWRDASQIDAALLKGARRLALAPVPNERSQSTLHTLRLEAPVGRFVYLLVEKGLRSSGGYLLGEPHDEIVPVPEFPRMLQFAQRGALLRLAGEKRVAVYARNLPGLRFEIARVLPEQIQNLVSQNQGSFARPEFSSYRGLTEDHLTELATEERALPKLPPAKGQYQALELGKHLGERKLGLFVLKVQGWDPATKRTTSEEDRRLVLVSNLGVVVKDQADGSHLAFVQSIASGDPVAGARVEVLGKNGLAVASAVTDAGGRAQLPALGGRTRSSTPTVYLVRHGNDVAFLPFGASEHYLNLSRFEVGGVSEQAGKEKLSAFLFSDRGLYRPGEEIRVGIVVKRRDWRSAELKDVPLEATVTDPRGLVVRSHKLRLGATGFEELRHTTPETAFTGSYVVSLYVARDDERGALLGSTTVQVREFLPDRLKISATLSAQSAGGWVSPKGLVARVSLSNLFGTPAADREVRARMELAPGFPAFRQHPGWRFDDWMPGRREHADDFDGRTDDKGVESFNLGLERFEAGTYKLTFTAQGLESEGGRGVVASTSAFVSYLPFLVGYKPDGDLGYLGRGSQRAIELMAIGPSGARRAVGDLRLALLERRHVSVLVRQPDLTYRFESRAREVQLSERALALPAAGVKLPVPTAKPGEFAFVVKRGERQVSRIAFSVAGDANVSRSLERSAELQLALKKRDLAPGEELELQVKAPFAGAGLITIERDRVYAHRWFKSATTASVQRIRVPAELEGNGYVSVALLRDAASPEILTPPLSYGVAPFTVSRARRTVRVELASAELTKPGEPLAIRYRCDRKARIVVFAVDEGILQVAGYRTPDPLAFFFEKRALGVRTAQILDQLLPEYAQIVSAPGGDGDDDDDKKRALARNLNPFKRRSQPPVAFWSGIVEADEAERTLSFRVPESFNGTLRVMAVAVAEEAVGAAERQTTVRGDFVLSPNVPTFVAPGDEFVLSVGVANNVKGSGARAPVAVALATSKHLEVVGAASQTLPISELREATASFKLRARPELGSATVTLTASHGGKSARLATELSVRPATPYLTTVAVGQVRGGEARVPIARSLYPEHRTLRAGISPLPLGVGHGLAAYLAKFPHGCTEQIVSQATPAMVLRDRPEFGLAKTAERSVASAIGTLRTRQNAEGGFGLWAANPRTSKFSSVYALHFLVEAKERGLEVPPEMLKRGLGWLRGLAAGEGEDLADERLRAYAVYVLTRAGVVTGSMAAALQRRLEKEHAPAWKKDLAAIYLAASYRLLRQERAATALIAGVLFGEEKTQDYASYYDGVIRDAQLLHVLARHFPQQAAKVSGDGIRSLVAAIGRGQYNTLSAAYVILGLDAYARTAAAARGAALSASELVAGKRRPLRLPAGLAPQADFSDGASALVFGASGGFEAFYAVTVAGFDREPPTKVLKQRLEVFREYEDEDGKVTTQVGLGEELTVRLRLRSLAGQALPSIALVDLLPGGFEVVVQPGRDEDADKKKKKEKEDRDDRDRSGDGEEGGGERDGSDDSDGGSDTSAAGGTTSVPIAVEGSTWDAEFGDVREDRVVLYGTAETGVKEFRYRIKAVSLGSFTIPPLKGESLYDRQVVAQSLGGRLRVVKRVESKQARAAAKKGKK